ncbi:MAG: hypothetical protein KY475_17135 [Planctomycetes bacterium]|nr:hypothetical protein [Planctomycetota bacterium]
MPRSRGLTIYLGLHVALALAALGGVLVTPWGTIAPSATIYFRIAAGFLAYFQAQFLATWMMLGPQRGATRLLVGIAASLILFAAPFASEFANHGLLRFSLKVAAVMTAPPLAVVVVALAPAWFGGRRIRYLEHRLRTVYARPQFSLRAMFVCTLVAAVFVATAQFFPIRLASSDETPLVTRTATRAGAGAFTLRMEASFSAAILAVPLANAVAAYVLLLPGPVWRLVPIPALAALACGVAASAVEMRGIPADAAIVGGACGVGSLFSTAHFLILRACGYRLVTVEKSPTPGT